MRISRPEFSDIRGRSRWHWDNRALAGPHNDEQSDRSRPCLFPVGCNLQGRICDSSIPGGALRSSNQQRATEPWSMEPWDPGAIAKRRAKTLWERTPVAATLYAQVICELAGPNHIHILPDSQTSHVAAVDALAGVAA